MKKDFFAKCASQWDVLSDEKYRLVKENIIPLLELKNGNRVLDACCGTGVLIPLLKEARAKISAIDYCPGMVQKAKSLFGADTEILMMDVEKLNYGDKTFDAIICHNAFPHINDKKKAVKEFARVLKNGGILIISHDENRKKIDALHANCGGCVAKDTVPSNDEFISFAAAAGFSTVEIFDEEMFFTAVLKRR